MRRILEPKQVFRGAKAGLAYQFLISVPKESKKSCFATIQSFCKRKNAKQRFKMPKRNRFCVFATLFCIKPWRKHIFFNFLAFFFEITVFTLKNGCVSSEIVAKRNNKSFFVTTVQKQEIEVTLGYQIGVRSLNQEYDKLRLVKEQRSNVTIIRLIAKRL